MMNDERAIYLLKSVLPKKVSYAQMICASNCYGDEMVYQEPEPYAIEYGIKAIEENTKLKAENEKLKESRDYLSKVNESLMRITDKQDREITKLKDRLEVKDNNFELYCDLVDANEKLYERLGRSIELPCTVGDIIYIIATCKDFPPKLDGTMWDSDGGYGTATGYYCPYEENCPHGENDCSGVESKLNIFEDVVVHVCIEEDNTWFVCENSNGWELKDFNKTVFLTREDAEQSLKVEVKE